jgi:hypothetical protein
MIDRVAYERRKSKVEDEDARRGAGPGEIDHQVRRFQVAVDDAARMGVRQPREDLFDERPEHGEGPRPRDGADLEPRQERPAGSDVHDQVRRLIGQNAEVACFDDCRMAERREAPGFLLKPPDVLRVGLGVGSLQALEGDRVAAVRVMAQVHDAHTAAPELTSDFVSTRENRPPSKGG